MAPVTNEGTQSLSDQFVGPVSPELPRSEVFPLIVAQSYILPHHVPTEPPRANTAVPPKYSSVTRTYTEEQKEWQEYLKRLTTEKEYILANAIIIAESGWKASIKNKTSSASGLAQYIDSTFSSYCIKRYKLTSSLVYKNDPYVQMDCLVAMLRDGGKSHWNASINGWGYVLK